MARFFGILGICFCSYVIFEILGRISKKYDNDTPKSPIFSLLFSLLALLIFLFMMLSFPIGLFMVWHDRRFEEIHRDEFLKEYCPQKINNSTELTKCPPARSISHIDIARKEQFSPHSLVTCLWACIDLLSYNLGKDIPLYDKAYLWTAYFYISAQKIDNQVIVDQISSKLIDDSRLYFNDRIRGAEPYVIIQSSFHSLWPVLNSSNIDTKTEEGRIQLWKLICTWLSTPLLSTSVGKKHFLCYATFARIAAQKYCETKHPPTNVSTSDPSN